jgi:hypothetical protein
MLWGQMQSELPPAKRNRLEATAALPAAAFGGVALPKPRLMQRGAPSKPRTSSQRSRPARSSLLGVDSLLGPAAGILRRIDDLHSRLLPLVRQAQESVAAQLQSRRGGGASSVALSAEQMLERRHLLAQLEALAHMPRLCRAGQLQDAQAAATAAEALHGSELPPPKAASPVAPVAAVPEVDTSATDVEDDE